MKSYIINLPRNVDVDIFNLPEDFKEIIEKSFSEYTNEAAKAHQYYDKLSYIKILAEETARVKDVDYDQIQKVVAEVIKIVMNYGD